MRDKGGIPDETTIVVEGCAWDVCGMSGLGGMGNRKS